MQTKVNRFHCDAELIVRFADGTERPADINDLVPAVVDYGYVVMIFRPGNHTEVYQPPWLQDAVEGFRGTR